MIDLADNTGAIQRGKPFEKGQSGNPAGRPKGSRNRASTIVQEMLDCEAENIGKKLIELAKAGEMQAIKMIVERLLPPLKELPLNADLSLTGINKATDITAAHSELLEGIVAGAITLSEAKELAGILEGKRKAIETLEVKHRLEELKNLIVAGRT